MRGAKSKGIAQLNLPQIPLQRMSFIICTYWIGHSIIVLWSPNRRLESARWLQITYALRACRWWREGVIAQAGDHHHRPTKAKGGIILVMETIELFEWNPVLRNWLRMSYGGWQARLDSFPLLISAVCGCRKGAQLARDIFRSPPFVTEASLCFWAWDWVE